MVTISTRSVIAACIFVMLTTTAESQTAAGGGSGPPNPKTKSNNPPPANQSGYSPYDVVSAQLSAEQMILSDPKGKNCGGKTVSQLIESFVSGADTEAASCIVQVTATAQKPSTNSADSSSTNTSTTHEDPASADEDKLNSGGSAIILHVMTWTTVSGTPTKYRPQQGAWGFYRVQKNGNLKQLVDLSGTPYFYGASHIYLVDLNSINLNDGEAEIDYTIQTTARQKQNQSDAGTLVSALLKISAGAAPTRSLAVAKYFGTISEIVPTVPVPYDVSVTATLNSKQSADGKPQQVCDQQSQGTQGKSHQGNQGNGGNQGNQTNQGDQGDGGNQGNQANQTPCSVSRTVTDYDTEYWDVSLGLAIPGPVETTYKSSTSSTGSTTVTPSKVTHTDAYAFVDLYLFEKASRAPASLSSAPHINFGIPITGQTLHRPYVGASENLGFLTSRIKLNIPLSVFAGPVFMKQQIEVPGTTTLKWDRATKMIYGLELSISSITNYLKGSNGGGSKKNASSTTGNGNSQ
jgi:hypothetical protein